ncbi:MAG: ATP-binding protein, partial [Planctomycetes bacterium]|nr:ATP-binding protein [Planctomycetota bacterium]
MDAPFLGRERELATLQQLHDSGRPELFVLYGRRRVGKTELLQQFCQGRRAVYFLAAQVREKDNLRAFRDALRDALGDELVGNVEFRDWGAALGYASERAAGERLVVVLDEFPYLCEANAGLPSQLQQFWDTRGKKSSLLLVLCGSQVSFMEEEVLAERSPLFGRRTAQRRLEPLRPPDAARFFAKWKPEDRLLAWAVLGGMPAYLRRFEPRESFEQNLLREALSPEGYLFDEPQFLLRAEFSSPTTYNSVLAAVAQGAQRVGDIALSVGVDATTANKYLHTLRELRIVARDIPLTDPDPLRSRRGTYRIEDRYLAFHFRHVQPNVSLIEAGRGARVLETSVQPDRGRLLEEARIDFAMDWLRHSAGELLGAEIAELGRHGGARVRIVGRLNNGALVAAALERPAGKGAARVDAELRAELD